MSDVLGVWQRSPVESDAMQAFSTGAETPRVWSATLPEPPGEAEEELAAAEQALARASNEVLHAALGLDAVLERAHSSSSPLTPYEAELLQTMHELREMGSVSFGLSELGDRWKHAREEGLASQAAP